MGRARSGRARHCRSTTAYPGAMEIELASRGSSSRYAKNVRTPAREAGACESSRRRKDGFGEHDATHGRLVLGLGGESAHRVVTGRTGFSYNPSMPSPRPMRSAHGRSPCERPYRTECAGVYHGRQRSFQTLPAAFSSAPNPHRIGSSHRQRASQSASARCRPIEPHVHDVSSHGRGYVGVSPWARTTSYPESQRPDSPELPNVVRHRPRWPRCIPSSSLANAQVAPILYHAAPGFSPPGRC